MEQKAKIDYKKEYKDLYLPPRQPVLIDVPDIRFIMVDGEGDPNGAQYQAAVGVLYALAFTIKMSKKSGMQPDGYFDYVVPPLEGLWGAKDGAQFSLDRRDDWAWTSMIRQPEFADRAVFEWAVAAAAKKKPEIDFSGARFETYREGLCVQMMHIGPYADEPASVEKMHAYAEENGCHVTYAGPRRHHEIYLGDPRKTKPEKLKTVIRLPVEKL